MRKQRKMTMGQAMMLCREKKGISRRELARLSGVCYQSIYYWENDWSFPRADLLTDVADALNVSLDELVGRRRQ